MTVGAVVVVTLAKELVETHTLDRLGEVAQRDSPQVTYGSDLNAWELLPVW